MFTKFTVIAAWVFLSLPVAAQTTQVWFAPIDPRNGLGTPDFMDLFRPGSPWPHAAEHVQVFKLYPEFVNSAPIGQLRQAVDGLRARHIQLAIEFGMLNRTATCGKLEGYGGLPSAQRAIQRLKAVGADLRYIAMDEPLWFGHRADGPEACHSTIESVARDAATTAAAFREAFPAVQVGDIEPMPRDTGPMVRDMARFADAWQSASGQKLAFMALDLSLMLPWVDTIQSAATMLQKHDLPLAIIYDGDGSDHSDSAWLSRAERRYEGWEADGRPAPAIALLQSWNTYPTRVLPETAPLSFTHFLLGYLRPRTVLKVSREGSTLHGRLTDAAGAPVVDASLSLERVAQSGTGKTSEYVMAGLVPPGAHSAVYVLRINDPECSCGGRADITLGPLHYTESGWPGDPLVPRWQGRPGAAGGRLHIVAAPGEDVKLNATTMPVVEGASYKAALDMRVSPGSAGSGYVGLVFLDATGKELSRAAQPLDATPTPAGTVTTGPNGTFQTSVPIEGDESIRVRFKGNDQLRGTVADSRR